ncbi:hypothetical protein AK812_SmicGene42044 [Symbiodinium microadriaticum]|uniref:Uncharacterized protein n=1 Tax=Symbiodinium microadriaticum TaxID=2951 RepID=A0A1Q9C4K6_SYMMI|nr:hypothetical protein AK812_SmicGene42044 [Symbiodinium microadriaticum]
MEVLEVINRIKRTNLGLGTLLEMCYHDNKGRLSFKGPIDVAAAAIGQIEVISGEVSEAYSQKFPLQDTLEREKRELEQMEEGLVQEKLGAQRLQSALRMRHHELAEKLQAPGKWFCAVLPWLGGPKVPKAIQSRLSVEPSGAK